MIDLTEMQVLLLRQIVDKPLTRLGRIPRFCQDLHADGYVRLLAGGGSLISVEITDRGRHALRRVAEERKLQSPSNDNLRLAD